jgi:hypothetical protein
MSNSRPSQMHLSGCEVRTFTRAHAHLCDTGNKKTAVGSSGVDGVAQSSSARPSSATMQRGVGYGTGSVRSKWDIERAIEEQMQRCVHVRTGMRIRQGGATGVAAECAHSIPVLRIARLR